MFTKYRTYSIFINGNNFDISNGKQTLAVGFGDFPLDSAKLLIDRNFETPILQEIRKIPTYIKNE